MMDFHVCNWLLSYEFDHISRTSQTQHYFCTFLRKSEIMFEKKLRYYWAIIISLRSNVHWQSENRSEVIWVHISRAFIKVSMYANKMFLKTYFRDSTCLRFRWLLEINKRHNRSFWRCNSLCLFTFMVFVSMKNKKHNVIIANAITYAEFYGDLLK